MVVKLSTRARHTSSASKPPCVQTAHTVANDMDLLVRKGSKDPGTKALCTKLDTSNWMYTRDENAISSSAQSLRNTSEVRSKRERTQPDPRKTEEPVGQDDWRMQPWDHLWGLSEAV